jgi:hypothetical protein
MSNGEPTKSDFGGLLSPGFFVLLASIVGYVTFQPPLKSVRPELDSSDGVPPPPSPPGLSAVHSRLWDDPLTVAFQDQKRALQDEQSAAGPLKYLLEHIPSTERKAGAGAAANVLPSQFGEIVGHIVDNKRAARLRKEKTLAGRVLCMPLLVPGGPYADDTEQRKRITYAVLSALNACDFNLTYPDRLTYVNVPLLVNYGATSSRIATSLVVPVKLFERSNAPGAATTGEVPEAVIVCWINEAQLGARPLAVVAQVLECLFGKVEDRESKVAVHILGPDSSDTLLDMAKEDSSLKQGADAAPDDDNQLYREATSPNYFSRYTDPLLFSGRATVSARYVASEDAGAPNPFASLSAFTNGRTTNCGLRVVRTIGTDECLVELIASELWLRGAWPSLVDPRAIRCSAEFQGNQGKYVVIVSELDTLSGQMLPRTLRNRFHCVFQASPPRARECDVLQVFSYLRGIDGKLPEKEQKDETTSQSGARSEVAEPDPLRAPSPETNSASGRSQIDFLRRLEGDLVRFHAEKRAQGEDGIVAIGVMGTDVYDKLLVLRALRGRFPSVCFFTTDSDAELSLSQEYPTTRNVVVASHFGLRLHPDLQGETPPFRDSYQTATYFQCLLAMRDRRLPQSLSQDDPWGLLDRAGSDGTPLEPLSFEVGRHGLYQVTVASNGSAGVHPPSPRETHWLRHWRHWLPALMAIVSLAWILSRMVTQIRKAIRPCLIGIVFCVGLLGLATWDHGRPHGEPFELFEGISLWPPTIIRAFAFMLAVGLIFKGWFDLEKIARKHETLVRSATAAVPAPLSRGLWGTLVESVDVSRKEIARLGPFAWLERDVIITHWPQGDTPTAMDLHEQYRLRGQALPRLLRSGTMSLAYLLFGGTLFSITDSPNMPFRGPTVRFWASSTLLAAVIFMIVVTFFSFDAMQLCRRFVKYIAVGPPNWPDSCTGMTRLKETRQPGKDDDVRELLTVQIIAERTQVVGKLVTYPFWVLLLLILSRHPSFDFLDFPPALLVLWGLSLGGALLWAWSLRREAGHARNQILSRLRNALAAASGIDDDASRRRAEQLRQFIADVRRENHGAFRPFMQDPIVTALATLLGGTGGVMLIEQLLPYR